MILKLKDILGARDSLNFLSAQKLPIQTAFKLASLLKELNVKLNEINKEMENIIKKVNIQVKQEQGISQEDIESRDKIINDLVNKEFMDYIEAETTLKINKIDFSSVKNVELSPKDIIALEPFFIFETVELF